MIPSRYGDDYLLRLLLLGALRNMNIPPITKISSPPAPATIQPSCDALMLSLVVVAALLAPLAATASVTLIAVPCLIS